MLDPRKKYSVLLFLSLAALSFSQSLDTLVMVPLRRQMCVRGSELCIRYDSTVSDSRCPIGMLCVWEGEVSIRLAVNGDTATLSDHSNLVNVKNETIVNGYTVKLETVYPYPGCTALSTDPQDARCSRLDSVAILSVSKRSAGVIGGMGSARPTQASPRFDKAIDPLGRVVNEATKFLKRSKLSLFTSIHP